MGYVLEKCNMTLYFSTYFVFRSQSSETEHGNKKGVGLITVYYQMTTRSRRQCLIGRIRIRFKLA